MVDSTDWLGHFILLFVLFKCITLTSVISLFIILRVYIITRFVHCIHFVQYFSHLHFYASDCFIPIPFSARGINFIFLALQIGQTDEIDHHGLSIFSGEYLGVYTLNYQFLDQRDAFQRVYSVVHFIAFK